MREERYFAYFVDIKDDGGHVVKAGTPLQYLNHASCGLGDEDDIPKAMKITFERMFVEKNQAYMVTQGALDTRYEALYQPIELPKALAMRLKNELRDEYYEKMEKRANRKRKIAKFTLNLFLWPFNLTFGVDCGEVISEDIMWQRES